MTLFLSYATQDHHYKDEIKKTLSKLERDGKIKLWIDEKNLRAGEQFDEVIEKAILFSDMFLLLLSRDFWASDYIQTYELPLILQLHKEKKALIVPIVLNDSYDLTGHNELKNINGLPREGVGGKRLKPIDEFNLLSKAYNSILQEIIRQLPEKIEVYRGAKYQFVKTFAGHRHKTKDLVEYNLRQLTIPQENLEICSDIRTDKFWHDRVFEAVNKAEYIVLFLSEGFVGSKFIQRSMLPVVHRQYHIGKCGLSLFLLGDCDFKRDETLNSFNVKPIKEVKQLQLAIDKASNIGYEKIEIDFSKLFLIYKVLQHYDKEKHQSIKLDDEGNIELYEDGVLVEKWKFVTPKEQIEEYAELYRESFDIQKVSFRCGLFQKGDLTPNVVKLQYFFETVINLYGSEVTKEVSEFFVKQFGTLSSFVQGLTDNKQFSLEMFDFNKDINANSGSIFFFLRFGLEGYQESNLIAKIYETIETKFEISIFKDNARVYTPKAFNKTFEKTLQLLENKRIVDFDEIILSVELLKSTLNLVEDLSFIEKNRELIEEPIVQKHSVSIAQLFVEPTAEHYFIDKRGKKRVSNVLEWFEEQLQFRSFILLLGDFGHGKTTLFKYLVSKLSSEYREDAPIPIFLTLREHFKTNHSLQEAVTNAIMPNSRMSDEFWNSHRWIVFCDGFDELNIFHQERPEWVSLVFSSLLKASQEKNIQIVISSRPILFMERDTYNQTIAGHDNLSLNNFNDKQITKWLERWSEHNAPITLQMLKERDIVDIARTPVILFLIALMFHDELADSDRKYSKSEIYKLFFDWTVRSGGLTYNEEDIKHKVPENYREIIQEVAWQIFTHPDSTSGLLHYKILLAQLKSKFGIDRFDMWDERVFVAHAFKESKKEHIEFLHQSLREYLVAEKLFGVYYAMKDEPEYQIDIHYDEILMSRPITEAKVNFFVDMVRTLSSEEKSQLKQRAKNIAHWTTILYQIAQKDASTFKGYSVFRTNGHNAPHKEHLFSENQVVLANLVLLGYLFEVNLYDIIEEDFNLELLKQIQHFFRSDTQLEQFEKLLGKLFFVNVSFLYTQFNGFDFDEYIFSTIEFKNLEFNSCSFSSCRLKDVVFENVTFNSCRFNKFEWLTFEHKGVCTYQGCHFYGYNYQNKTGKEEVEYKQCIFEDSDLYYENFKGAVFKDCTFLETSFSTNEKIDKESMDIEFVDCLLKKKGEVEVLNGKHLDVFVETGGDRYQ